MKRLNLLKTAIACFAAMVTISCGGGGPTKIDYTQSEEVRLSLDYQTSQGKDRDFYTDGIAKVTLRTPIDGDTAHFDQVVANPSSTKPIKARFWGVDTPESTGRVEEYGKQASNFTKEKLKKANADGTIVVSTPREDYGEPTADSTGERYVSLIWISLDKKDASFDELILLNLWIVQEGLSYVKNVSDIPEYQTIFIAAEKQARDLKLKLWSGKPDPEFNYGTYQTCALLDLKHEIERRIEGLPVEESFDGAKVRVVGTVAGFSDGIMYLQNFYTIDQGGSGTAINPYTGELGEYAGINIFCGTSSIPSKYTALGTYLELCGIAQYSETFGFQMTGAQGHFPSVESMAEDDDVHILIRAENNTEEYQLYSFEYTAAQLNAKLSSTDLDVKYTSFYCSNKITEPVTVTKFYKNNNNGEITLTFGTNLFQAHITTLYRGNPHDNLEYWASEEDFMGKSFYMRGVLSSFTSTNSQGVTTTRYQFVFSKPSDELHCTDYYDADGNVLPEED